MLLKKDLHIHATAHNAFPTEGHTVANVSAKCNEVGLDYAGILEHMNNAEKHPIICIDNLVAEYRSLALPKNFFLGVEADIYPDGSDSCGIDNRRRYGLDYVIGSVHLDPTRIRTVEEYIDEELRRITLALENNKCIDIIGHPWVQGIRWERNGSIPRWSFAMVPATHQNRIIELAKSNNIALEVNNLSKIIENDSGYMEFLERMLKSGVLISVGSDAHQMENIKNSIFRIDLLEKMGFDNDRIWIPEKQNNSK
jgi:histidinol phosphatase-like PHP family hydrolase